jgi:periplasmic glucans biosynthesis protein
MASMLKVCASVVMLLVGVLHVASAQTPQPRFSYETVVDEARRLAAAPYGPPDERGVPAELRKLGYDQFQRIRFKSEGTLWRDQPGFFRAQFFPAAFLYTRPVTIHVVDDGVAATLSPRSDLFDWSAAGLSDPLPDTIAFSGVRLLFPLHTPRRDDEIAAFLGASYFRLLGREQVYGVSARGLAIDTGLPQKEEFPYFRAFWLVRPPPAAREVVLFALLDSPSLTGAYEFLLRPGTETTAEVRLTLFARQEVSLLGLAPLTSMYLSGESTGPREGDFRPEVHDSDGLLIESAEGEWIWRPLTNPRALTVTSFSHGDPRGFGLLQRDREFAHYQDLQALYHRRPSMWVEPVGRWGEGEIRLLEIPSNAEIHDNVAAFWAPAGRPRPQEPYAVSYRLHAFWDAARLSPRGRVVATRMASTRLPGTGPAGAARRFIVEFGGGDLAGFRTEQPVEGQIDLSSGKLTHSRVEPIAASRSWRLTFDVEPDGKSAIDMRAYLRLYDEALTETWTYLWRPQ